METEIRCYICNAYIEEPEFDNNYKCLPCPSCNDSVNDTLSDFEEESFDDDDEGEELDEEELP